MTMARTIDVHAQATRLDALQGRHDRLLLGAAACLAVLGVVMVTSASMAVAETLKVGDYFFVKRHLLALALGVGLAFAAMQVELKRVEKHRKLALGGCFALLLIVFMPGVGERVNGAQRWIDLGVLNFQTVEAVKLLMIIWLASYLARHRDGIAERWWPLILPFGVVTGMVALLMMQPDFGSSALLLVIAGCMIFLGGSSWKKLLILGTLGVAVFAAFAVFEPYRLARLTGFREPFEDPFGGGYQLVQALIAIGRGEWFGVGLGASVQKLQAFPEVHTDFIFSVLAEELGFAGVALTLALFTVVVWRAFSIGLRCMHLRRQFAGLVALGIGCWIGVQSVVSIGVNLGLLPTKGLTLPMISYGGSSLMMTCAALGVLLRVSYELDRAERQVQRARGEFRQLDEPGESVLPATLMAQAARSAPQPAARPGARIEPVMGSRR